MSAQSEAVRKWRRETKKRILESLGGKCVCCGYSKSEWALECHHLDRSQKEFELADIWQKSFPWKKIVLELRKCVLLCSNCHKEVEHGITQLPENPSRFDESYSTYTSPQGKIIGL